MAGTQYFGYALIVGSAILLARHHQQWRELGRVAPANPRRRQFFLLQLQRRSVASALIGVVGAAMTLVDYVPRRPVAMTCYLFGLLMGATVILSIALADLRAVGRRRDDEQLQLVADELRKLDDRPHGK